MLIIEVTGKRRITYRYISEIEISINYITALIKRLGDNAYHDLKPPVYQFQILSIFLDME
jgi:hypothetical protein